jgi:hypothetical protein
MAYETQIDTEALMAKEAAKNALLSDWYDLAIMAETALDGETLE